MIKRSALRYASWALAILFVVATTLLPASALRQAWEPGASPAPATPAASGTPTATPSSQEEWEREHAGQLTQVEGIYNILLIGVDARKDDFSGLSDTMIICTLDTVHKKTKMTSIMRDLYVEYPNRSRGNKINSAHLLGGPEYLVETIEQNFQLKIDYYAVVNFTGFIQLIDSLGGIEVDLPENLIRPLNKVITITVKQSPDLSGMGDYVTSAGKQTLTGMQTLAYARMRKGAGNDQARTDRQREVVSKVMQKLSATPFYNYPSVLGSLIGYFKTDIGLWEAVSLAYGAVKNGVSLEPEQLRLPLDGLYRGYSGGGLSDALLSDLPQLARILNAFIADDVAPEEIVLDQASYKQAVSQYMSRFGGGTLGTTKPAATPKASTPSPTPVTSPPLTSEPADTAAPSPTAAATPQPTPTPAPTPSPAETSTAPDPDTPPPSEAATPEPGGEGEGELGDKAETPGA